MHDYVAIQGDEFLYGVPQCGHRDCFRDARLPIRGITLAALTPTILFSDCLGWNCYRPLFCFREERFARVAVAQLVAQQEESMQLLESDRETSDDLDRSVERGIHRLFADGISFAEEQRGNVMVRRDGIPWVRYTMATQCWETVEVIHAQTTIYLTERS